MKLTMFSSTNGNETFEAYLTPTGGGAAMGESRPIKIVIKAWTTDDQAQQHVQALNSPKKTRRMLL